MKKIKSVIFGIVEKKKQPTWNFWGYSFTIPSTTTAYATRLEDSSYGWTNYVPTLQWGRERERDKRVEKSKPDSYGTLPRVSYSMIHEHVGTDLSHSHKPKTHVVAADKHKHKPWRQPKLRFPMESDCCFFD